jgi:hypothetical protein
MSTEDKPAAETAAAEVLGAGQTHTTRVLTFSVSLYVRPGLVANIRMKRISSAIDRFEGLIKGAAAATFPWAGEILMDVSYDYRWFQRRGQKESLPATAENGG